MSEIIKSGQQHSIDYTGHSIDTDGIYGSETKANCIRCLQIAMNQDYDAGLDVDGIFGSLSSAAIDGHYVKQGETQEMVRALQIGLMCRGYDPNGIDGVFGGGTWSAVTCFQGDNNLAVDGIAGVDTFSAVFDITVQTSSTTSTDSGEWQKYDASNLPNFSADEFKCACGCGGDVCDELKCKAQLMRDKLTAYYGCDMPMTITSGFRCYEQNIREGGIDGSLHTKGQAFDFQIYRNGSYHMDADLINVAKEIAHQCGCGVGTYYSTGFLHIQNEQWDYSGD